MRMRGGDLPDGDSQACRLLVHGSGKPLSCRVHELVMVGKVSRGVSFPLFCVQLSACKEAVSELPVKSRREGGM